MTDANTVLIWVVLFRAGQTALEAVPTLLIGLFLAGLIRGVLNAESVRRWFTNDPIQGPIRAWLVGLLLPVCSFGAMPVAWELKRVGVPRNTVITFLLSAPLINPMTLIYAFQKLEGEGPVGLLALALFLAGSFMILVGLGFVLGRCLPESNSAVDVSPPPASSGIRMAAVGLTMSRALTSGFLVYLLSGLAGSGLLALISGGALERTINDRLPLAPVHLALVSIPFQASPTKGIMIVTESLLGGRSIGMAFVVFLLGIGVHIGTLAWIAIHCGTKRLLLTMTILFGGTISAGYALPLTLPNSIVTRSQFLEIESGGGFKVAKARAIRSTLTDDFGEPQRFLIGACIALSTLWLVGLVSSCLGERGSITRLVGRATAVKAASPANHWNRHLEGPQRTLAAMMVAVATVVAGLYVYYPLPKDLLDQFDATHLELGQILKSDPIPISRSQRLLTQLRKDQNKLTISDLIRRGSSNSALGKSSTELRSAIEKLKQAINERGSLDELRPLSTAIREASLKCRAQIER